jgi:hypothetical protein
MASLLDKALGQAKRGGEGEGNRSASGGRASPYAVRTSLFCPSFTLTSHFRSPGGRCGRDDNTSPSRLSSPSYPSSRQQRERRARSLTSDTDFAPPQRNEKAGASEGGKWGHSGFDEVSKGGDRPAAPQGSLASRLDGSTAVGGAQGKTAKLIIKNLHYEVSERELEVCSPSSSSFLLVTFTHAFFPIASLRANRSPRE